jgi:hypothetical protein
MKLIGYLFFCLLSTTLVAQNSVFKATDSIAGNFSHFSIDNFGRIYGCQNDVIVQYYFQKDSLLVNSTSLKSFRPSSMESSKSFRTLVFDKERSLVRFYDNTLTDIHGEINLVDAGIQQPVLVCESFAGNSIWVLDGGMMRLLKLNQELEIILQTENLVTLFDNFQEPSQLIETNDFLYVLVPSKGVAIFDVFGTFIKMYPTNAKRIGTFNKYLLLQTDDKIQAVSTDVFMEVTFEYDLPKGVLDFYFAREKVYFLQNHQVLIGSFISSN